MVLQLVSNKKKKKIQTQVYKIVVKDLSKPFYGRPTLPKLWSHLLN